VSAPKISSKPTPKSEMESLVQWGKENSAKLNSCTRHDFTRMDEGVFSQYRCAVCGGVASGQVAQAYQLGLKHAAQSAKE